KTRNHTRKTHKTQRLRRLCGDSWQECTSCRDISAHHVVNPLAFHHALYKNTDCSYPQPRSRGDIPGSAMIKLTARQEQILNLIRDAIDNTGFPPTRAEIAAELGFRSANAAEEHLQALARKGAIEISPGTSRGIRLKDHGSSERGNATQMALPHPA